MRRLLPLLLCLLLGGFIIGHNAHAQNAQTSEGTEAEYMLRDLAGSYRHDVSDSLPFIIQFDIQPAQQSWHVIVESTKRATLHRGPNKQAAFIFATTLDTLRLIYEGKMTAMTAGGKARGSDSAPLEFETTEAAGKLTNARQHLLSFVQHFFQPSKPERILLGEEYSRFVHGAHVVPLYYAPGLRSAWYMVKKGQRLNEPGDTNPFPQAFIIISGMGFAKIGDTTIQVKANESYYIPPNSDHVLWTESDEPIVLIWIAWGEGA